MVKLVNIRLSHIEWSGVALWQAHSLSRLQFEAQLPGQRLPQIETAMPELKRACPIMPDSAARESESKRRRGEGADNADLEFEGRQGWVVMFEQALSEELEMLRSGHVRVQTACSGTGCPVLGLAVPLALPHNDVPNKQCYPKEQAYLSFGTCLRRLVS